jgi:hypothetical protein
MAGKRDEGLLVRAHPLEQAERISRSMVEVRIVDDALLLAADPAWAGAINTVLVTKGVRVSELRQAPYKRLSQQSRTTHGYNCVELLNSGTITGEKRQVQRGREGRVGPMLEHEGYDSRLDPSYS